VDHGVEVCGIHMYTKVVSRRVVYAQFVSTSTRLLLLYTKCFLHPLPKVLANRRGSSAVKERSIFQNRKVVSLYDVPATEGIHMLLYINPKALGIFGPVIVTFVNIAIDDEPPGAMTICLKLSLN